MTILRALTLLLAVVPAPHLVVAEDLPSPDAMALGPHVVPVDLVDGLRRGIEDEALARLPGGAPQDVAAQARARLAPILDEAFPPELLAGIGATFLARHYTADELRALRAFEDSPLGAKLRSLHQAAPAAKGVTPEKRDEARDAQLRKALTPADRTQLDEFAASPLGKKSAALAPDLAAFFMEQLERRWSSVRAEVEPRLRAAAAPRQ